MNGFQPDRVDEKTTLVNQRTVNEHIDDAYYKCYINAAMFSSFTPAIATSERFDYWVFTPATSFDRVVANVYVPRLWIAGNVEATIYYTGDVIGGGTDIGWEWTATGTALNGSVAMTDVTAQAFVPGPAVVDTLQRYTFASYLPVASEDLLIGTRVLRLGADVEDSYAGDVHFIGMLLRFVPANQTLDTKGRVP